MKRCWFILFALVISQFSFSQINKIEELVNQADRFYESGFYKDAVKNYTSALKADSKNLYLKYRLSLCYYELENYKDAAYFSSEVVMEEFSFWGEAVLVYASSLQNEGQYKQAVKVYEKALKKRSDDDLFLYNLAAIYYDMGEYAKALEFVQKSIVQNKANPNAHFLFAHTLQKENMPFKSLLPLHYFLLLDQDSDKSVEVWDEIFSLWSILPQTPSRNDKFDVEENEMENFKLQVKLILGKENREAVEKFIEISQLHLNLVSSESSKELNFYQLYYLDLFQVIAQKGYSEILAYYISNCKSHDHVFNWVRQHQQEFQEFITWLELSL